MSVIAATTKPDNDEVGHPVATIDLGSNSFHMLVARYDGALVVVDGQKEMVRLAAGLDDDRRLAPDAQERAIAALRRFAERLRGISPEHVRAVGTNTLRAARQPSAFLERASAALGYPIEIIDGVEEARLVYLGVVHCIQPASGTQLVVDIGGGSTEVVLGEGFEATHCHSLRMGCVTFTRGFFPDGEITKDRLRGAVFAASNELGSLEPRFRDAGWTRAIGSSGTIRAIDATLRAEGMSEAGITREGLEKLQKALLDAGKVSKIELAGLSERRREVILGGFAILWAVFERLHLDTMIISEGALREGAAYDLVGRFKGHDLREATLGAMQRRYGVDVAQADRVARRLSTFVDMVRDSWDLGDPRWLRYGRWAAALHEIGLSLSYAGYHRHGAYLAENCDMAGFSRTDQQVVAALVLCHRRKLRHEALTALSGVPGQHAVRLAALLRLAVRFERSRGTSEAPDPHLEAQGDHVVVTLPRSAEDHPLLLADLAAENERLARADISLDVREATE